jgi:Tol biopolymer transport system component
MLPAQSYRKPLLFLLCLVGLTTLASCAPKSNRFGIIFVLREIDGAADIQRISSDETQGKLERLTFTPTVTEYILGASQNGATLVFTTDFYYDRSEMEPSELAIEQPRHVYLLDTASKELTDVTNVVEDKYPQVGPEFYMDWLPEQKQFVLVTHAGGGYEIRSFLELVDFDGKSRKEILIPTTEEIPSLIKGVKWSPDGKKFLLMRGVIGVEQQIKNPGVAMLVYDLENGKLIQLAGYKDHCLPQAWSPASRQVAATCRYIPAFIEGVLGIKTVRIFDIENPGQPYEHVGFSPCEEPSWSPDGKQLVFVCDKDKDHQGLFVVNSDGNGIREVGLGNLGNPAVLRNPTWSPDGTQIVYVAGSDYRRANIYSVHLDGSNNYPLTNREAFYGIVSVYPLP